jgi:hypothetical protein
MGHPAFKVPVRLWIDLHTKLPKVSVLSGKRRRQPREALTVGFYRPLSMSKSSGEHVLRSCVGIVLRGSETEPAWGTNLRRSL